jgi:hypothetical protein
MKSGSLFVLAVVSGSASCLAGTVRIPDATYGAGVTVLVGNQGSVGGPINFGVGPISSAVPPAGGTFGTSIVRSVGPVQPGQIVSLPGTTAIATSSSASRIIVTPGPTSTVIDLDIVNNQSVVLMDGGSYIAQGGGMFNMVFSVDQPTPYTLTGTLAMDTEDAVAYVQMVGQPIFITPAGNGPVNVSGVLAPGSYIFRGSTSTRSPEGLNNTGSESDASSIDLTLTIAAPLGNTCDSIDFNNDGSSFDPQDIDAFLSVFSEGPCVPGNSTCNDIDFNNDGSLFDPCDIDAFVLVFSEGPCTACGQ